MSALRDTDQLLCLVNSQCTWVGSENAVHSPGPPCAVESDTGMVYCKDRILSVQKLINNCVHHWGNEPCYNIDNRNNGIVVVINTFIFLFLQDILCEKTQATECWNSMSCVWFLHICKLLCLFLCEILFWPNLSQAVRLNWFVHGFHLYSDKLTTPDCDGIASSFVPENLRSPLPTPINMSQFIELSSSIHRHLTDLQVSLHVMYIYMCVCACMHACVWRRGSKWLTCRELFRMCIIYNLKDHQCDLPYFLTKLWMIMYPLFGNC